MDLTNKIIDLHHALRDAELPHAFGGALALAWCTGRARGTIDIDINVFVEPEHTANVINALPDEMEITAKLQKELRRDGQVRLLWDKTPVDIFLNTVRLHQKASQRVFWETFADEPIPFLSCADIAVFKIFFNRTKDWADLEEMAVAGTIDLDELSSVVTQALGGDDERIHRLNALPQSNED
ncbi:MAG: hypothetical protein AAF384_14665 [Pseudomonadota bacterium]